MLTVYKYEVPIGDYFELELPKGADILDIAEQQHSVYFVKKVFLWALVDPDNQLITRKFRFAGTGHPITENSYELLHRGTFQTDGGALIFHIFEIV